METVIWTPDGQAALGENNPKPGFTYYSRCSRRMEAAGVPVREVTGPMAALAHGKEGERT